MKIAGVTSIDMQDVSMPCIMSLMGIHQGSGQTAPM